MNHKLRLGIIVPTGAMLPFNARLDYPKTKEAVILAEKLGYESLWFPDHLFIKGGKVIGERWECLTIMTASAAVTEKIRLGANVLCNLFRSPSVLAKAAATLDVVSGGRSEFALGSGWHKAEADAYGIPFPKFEIRSKMLREALEVIKRMWTEENPTYKGNYYSIDGAVNLPKPIQKPHPPIIIGGSNREYTLPIAAEYADEWNMFNISAPDFREKSEFLDRLIEDIGRDPGKMERSVVIPTLVSEDMEEIKRKVRLLHADDLKEGYQERSIFGTPETCIERLQEYIDAGVTRVVLNFLDVPNTESLSTFAEEYMNVSQA